MGKHLGSILALSLGLFPVGASALTLQTLDAPDGAAQFVNPEEKRSFSSESRRDGRGFDMWREPSSGFRFSISGDRGGNGTHPMFVPGLTVPDRFGPVFDPQTRDPYPR